MMSGLSKVQGPRVNVFGGQEAWRLRLFSLCFFMKIQVTQLVQVLERPMYLRRIALMVQVETSYTKDNNLAVTSLPSFTLPSLVGMKLEVFFFLA